MNNILIKVSSLAIMVLVMNCQQPTVPGTSEHLREITTSVSQQALSSDDEPGDWLTHGGNYAEDRFSQLNQINRTNVADLGLAWALNLQTKRGIEASPLVVDGIMFLTGPWSKVYAVNARDGKLLWNFDPKVPGRYGAKACCDVVNRGLAMLDGSLFLGTIDGRLISIDAATGSPNWEVLTVDTTKFYTITGAPRVADGKVIIGNGGAEYGVRGYVTAYDASTGRQAWRFYTVPGDPSQGFESPEMEMAAKTWSGNWWEHGGGGTAWDAMAYDPELKLLYVGTGNGSPWVRPYRSPGGGDNLFLSSIVAIHIESGSMAWYYQTTPGETWDFTATQHIILADLSVGNKTRKVLMQAPKNGFFYVLDRETGELLSADPYVYVNWASGVDLETGRPIESEHSRFEKVNATVAPNYDGGHNWHPMAYNPNTGLVYIPALDNGSVYGADPNWAAHESGFGVGLGWNVGTGGDPSKPTIRDSMVHARGRKAKLIAWDPVKKQPQWTVDHPTYWNGGVLTTAGNLVFQGTSDGRLVAFDAEDGSILWQKELGIGMIAPPVTYLVDGVQYVSIAAGWGGGVGQKFKFTPRMLPGTLFTFTLGRDEPLLDYPEDAPRQLIDLPVQASTQDIDRGRGLFMSYCALCHALGTGGGNIPDLAYSPSQIFENLEPIVLQGVLEPSGMPNFSDQLNSSDVEMIRQFILQRAQTLREAGP